MGSIKSKIDETTLISYLEQIAETEKPTSSIKVRIEYHNNSSRER